MKSIGQEVSDLFSVLHDGGIEHSERNNDTLSFSVEIKYLTDRIEDAYEIYVTISGFRNTEFVAWMNNGESEAINDFILEGLDILSAKIENGKIRADFNNSDSSLAYCGGTLYFNCDSYLIEAPKGTSITLDQIKGLATAYWNDFSNRRQNQTR